MRAERREQVFVSSTYLDLKEERQEVIQTLLEASCFPAGMELFPASDFDKWSLIKKEIDDSDYYIVIVGGRYGSVDEQRGLSYTEMEFDYAVEVGKPVLGFLHGNPGSIPANRSELDASARERLDSFREKVGARMVKYWTSPQDLGGQVAKSLIQIRRSHPAEGWVRASQALTPDIEEELSSLRLRVRELEADLRQSVLNGAENHEDLARGREVFALDFTLTYRAKDKLKVLRKSYRLKLSWDAIFAAVGPILLIEGTTAAIESELERAGVEVAVKRRLPEDFGDAREFDIDVDSLNTVLVQLTALGLIEESKKRHQISDTNQYWQLTPFGRSHLVALRAERPAGDAVAADEGRWRLNRRRMLHRSPQPSEHQRARRRHLRPQQSKYRRRRAGGRPCKNLIG